MMLLGCLVAFSLWSYRMELDTGGILVSEAHKTLESCEHDADAALFVYRTRPLCVEYRSLMNVCVSGHQNLR